MNQASTTHNEVDWTHVHRSNFESAVFGATKWVQKAIDLFESAKRLEPEIIQVWEGWRALSQGESVSPAPDYFQGTYFMLMSFSVENFLKAALVQKNSAQYERAFHDCLAESKPSRKCFPPELKTHDLFDLAVKAELSLFDGEEDFLRRLSRCAEWAGRYPSPLRYEAMSGAEIFSDGDEYSVSWFGGNDVERLNNFIKTLPARLGLHTRHWEQENDEEH